MNIKKSFLYTTPLAHRGLHGNGIPENSRAAFNAAIREGYAIETDVRCTKDNVIIIFHDDTLTRMTGLDRKVIDLDYEEIRKLCLAGTQEKIMTLHEFLDYINGRVPVLIELKDVPERRYFPAMVVGAMQGYKGEYAYQAFNPLYVLKLKKLAPNILRGQLAVDIFSPNVIEEIRKHCDMLNLGTNVDIQSVSHLDDNAGIDQIRTVIADIAEQSGFAEAHKHWKIDAWIIKNMILNFISKPNFVSYCSLNLPYKRVRKAHKKSAVLGWVVRSQEELERVTPFVDNIIFEEFSPEPPPVKQEQ